jgi:hypothetical protein
VLWESLDEEEQVKCWELLEQEKGWVVWCRAGTDLLYLCDSETTLIKVSRWIGRGLQTTLAGDANADIISNVYVQE